MPNRTLPLDDDGMYHIYNRAVGNEVLFRSRGDYQKFTKNIDKYLLPEISLWCYCLLPNHFHFLIRIKHESDGVKVSKAISDCCNSYTKWLNTVSSRKGNLFMRPFKRTKIQDDTHLAWTIWYIHRNPLHHKLSASVGDWEFSSYQPAVSGTDARLSRSELLDFFGGSDSFVQFHRVQQSGF